MLGATILGGNRIITQKTEGLDSGPGEIGRQRRKSGGGGENWRIGGLGGGGGRGGL